MINHYELLDLGFKGSKYTWLNKRFQHSNALILERLDRILVINDWLLKYPNAHIMHLPCTHSDHCPLLLTLFHNDPTLRKRSFRLEKIWTNYPDFKNIVAQVWKSDPSLMYAVRDFANEVSAWACQILEIFFLKKEIFSIDS